MGKFIRNAFTGVRIAVCALVLDTLIKLQKDVMQNYISAIILVFVFILSAVFSVSPVLS